LPPGKTKENNSKNKGIDLGAIACFTGLKKTKTQMIKIKWRKSIWVNT